MKHEPQDLHWLAFRYIAGELDDDQRADFEVRLGDEQAAREAVAAALELTLAISHAEELAETCPVAAPASAWWQRASWMVVGAATVLVIVWSVMGGPRRANNGLAVNRGAVDPQLAVLWTETRGTLTAAEMIEPALLWAEPEVDVEQDAVASGEPSSWILSAVMGLHQGHSESSNSGTPNGPQQKES